MRTVPVDGVVKSVAWNPHPTICLVAVAVCVRPRVPGVGWGDRPMPEDLHLTLTVGRTRCCC